jgi:hypothetical protein
MDGRKRASRSRKTGKPHPSIGKCAFRNRTYDVT